MIAGRQVHVMAGASAGVAGEQGVVPQPLAGQQAYLLTGAGVWQAPVAYRTRVTGLPAGTQVLELLPLTSIEAVRWWVAVVDGTTNRRIEHLSVTHDGSQAFIVRDGFAVVGTGVPSAPLTVDVDSGNLRLIATPVSSGLTVAWTTSVLGP